MVQWFSETPLEAAKHRFKSCCFHLQAVSFQSSSGSFLNPISKVRLFEKSESGSLSVASDSLQPHRLCGPPGSSVYGILQAIILDWVARPSFRESSRPWDQTQIYCIAGGFFAV